MENNANARWMIYGANGYTGRLCVCEAERRHLQPVLGGRNADEIEQMARDFNLEARVFELADPAVAASNLAGIDIVLNCAGPFSQTAALMLDACARGNTDYVDVTGELDVFEYVQQNRQIWSDAGIVVIPGAGFDVVPSDCLAAMLKKDLPGANRLMLAFSSPNMKISPGTAKTIIEGIAGGCRVRRNGTITSIPLGSKTATIPFDSGEMLAVAISWGDVSTAWYSTGIPDIDVYMAVKPGQLRQIKMLQRLRWLAGMPAVQRLIKWHIERKVEGPTDTQRAASWAELYGEVADAAGGQAAMTMRTPDGYDLTADAAVTAVSRLFDKPLEPGCYTPSQAFGAEYVLELRGVTRRRAE